MFRMCKTSFGFISHSEFSDCEKRAGWFLEESCSVALDKKKKKMHKTFVILSKNTDYGRMFKNTVCIEQTWRLMPFPCGSPCLQSQLHQLFPIKQTRNKTQATNGHNIVSVHFARLQSGSLSKQKIQKASRQNLELLLGRVLKMITTLGREKVVHQMQIVLSTLFKQTTLKDQFTL